MILRHYVVPFLLSAACSFDEDRSLGHLETTPSSGSGGTATGAQSTIPEGGHGPTKTGSGGATASSTEAACTQLDSSACTETQYCSFDTDCGHVTAGRCRERPQQCDTPSTRAVVCGCDHHYYVGVCEAQRAGISLALLSECPPVECDDKADCTRFEESCPFYYGATFPDATCSANLTCACENAIIQ